MPLSYNLPEIVKKEIDALVSAAIIHRIAQGEEIKDILDDYPRITRQDIKAALEYASSLVRGEDVIPIVKG